MPQIWNHTVCIAFTDRVLNELFLDQTFKTNHNEENKNHQEFHYFVIITISQEHHVSFFHVNGIIVSKQYIMESMLIQNYF